MVQHWKRWEMEKSSRPQRLISHPKRNEHLTITFSAQCWVYAVLTLQQPLNIGWGMQRAPHELENNREGMQHCMPRRHLGNTSCERWRWLSQPSRSTFTEERNAKSDHPSSAPETFSQTSQIWETNHGTQINKRRHNTTHPWKHNYDGNRNMNDQLRQQRCHDLPDHHNVRLIDLIFTR